MDLKKTVAYSLITAGVAGFLAFSSTEEVQPQVEPSICKKVTK